MRAVFWFCNIMRLYVTISYIITRYDIRVVALHARITIITMIIITFVRRCAAGEGRFEYTSFRLSFNDAENRDALLLRGAVRRCTALYARCPHTHARNTSSFEVVLVVPIASAMHRGVQIPFTRKIIIQ